MTLKERSYLTNNEVELGIGLVHLVSLQQTEVGTAQQVVLGNKQSVVIKQHK